MNILSRCKIHSSSFFPWRANWKWEQWKSELSIASSCNYLEPGIVSFHCWVSTLGDLMHHWGDTSSTQDTTSLCPIYFWSLLFFRKHPDFDLLDLCLVHHFLLHLFLWWLHLARRCLRHPSRRARRHQSWAGTGCLCCCRGGPCWAQHWWPRLASQPCASPARSGRASGTWGSCHLCLTRWVHWNSFPPQFLCNGWDDWGRGSYSCSRGRYWRHAPWRRSNTDTGRCETGGNPWSPLRTFSGYSGSNVYIAWSWSPQGLSGEMLALPE